MIISQMLRLGFSKEIYQILPFEWFHFGLLETYRVHVDFENIWTFKTQISSHAKTSKDKQKLKSQEIRTLEM